MSDKLLESLKRVYSEMEVNQGEIGASQDDKEAQELKRHQDSVKSAIKDAKEELDNLAKNGMTYVVYDDGISTEAAIIEVRIPIVKNYVGKKISEQDFIAFLDKKIGEGRVMWMGGDIYQNWYIKSLTKYGTVTVRKPSPWSKKR